MLDTGDRSCALEATSHGSELGRLDGVRFSALAFTNLSQDHLDFHGTFERYFDAKRRLFVQGERPPAAVNVDDDYGRRLAEELRALGHEPLLTFGTAGDADIRPEQLELDGNGARLRAGGIELRTKLRGRFNVENVLAAVAVSRLLRVENDAIAAGVEALGGVPGRFEAVEAGQPFAVVVDYSHKPDALENVLRTARELARSRVICVFGCGGDRDRGKRPLMGRIASELADVAIVTSDNPRSEDPDAIIAEVVAGAEASLDVEPDRATAIGRALALAQEGDVVVIAGKGHEQGQEFAGRVVPFDDREVAREALRRLGAAL
jgi:UDP-N-acetylmuramoyl-L-alanyl-D-glutamate--2,6-diaminopimelate ligase